MRDPQSLKSRSFGFVSYARREDAARAIIDMQGRLVGRRAVRTGWAQRRPGEARRTVTYEDVLRAADGSNASVYVGSLAADVTEAELRALFERFGTVRQVRLFTPRNYGFVVFDCTENAARAIHEMGGHNLRGQALTCSWGRAQEVRLHPCC